MNKNKILLIILGVSILSITIYVSDPKEILQKFIDLIENRGFYSLVIFLPYIAVITLDTLGWRYVIISKEKSFNFIQLLKVKLAGDFVNNVTPAGSIAGEPIKAHILKRYNVPLVEGMASVYMGKLLMAKGQLFFILIGLFFAFSFLVGEENQKWLISGVIFICAFSVLMGILYYVGSKKGILNLLLSLLEKVGLKFSFIEKRREQLNLFDEKIAHFYKNHKKAFAFSIFSFFFSWLMGAFELFIIVKLLGAEISYTQALFIESVNTIIRSASFFIPGSLGAVEAGYVLLFKSIGLEKETAWALAILRRARELLWVIVGMFLLSKFDIKLPGFKKRNKVTSDSDG